MSSPDDGELIASALTHRYGRRLALSDVSLSLRRGVTTLLGPNGAGKTTLLRLLAGDLPIQSGTVRRFGQDGADGSRRVGFLTQNPLMIARLSASEFVAYCAWLAGSPARDASALADDALNAVGLSERAKDKVGSLSGGMQRRLAIAAILVSHPGALLLDEPTVGLDPLQRQDLRDLLIRLGKTMPVLIATHMLDDVHKTSDTVLLMYGGRLIYQGSPQDFIGSVHIITADMMETAYRRRISAEEDA